MKDAVYSEQCRSGHKNHTVNGRVPTLWPGSTLHYMEALRDVRADDWEVKYNGNRFAWLGNGISQTEFDPTSDLAWYIRSRDDGPYSSRRKRRRYGLGVAVNRRGYCIGRCGQQITIFEL